MLKKTMRKFYIIGLLLLVLVATVLSVSADNGYYSVAVDYAEGCGEDMGLIGVAGLQSDSTRQKYLYGSEVTLTAVPKTGYKFVGWYNADTGKMDKSESSWKFNVDGNCSYYAKFEPCVYTIHYEIPNTDWEGMNHNGKVTSHTYGQTTTIPNPTLAGYDFNGWVIVRGSDRTEPKIDLSLGQWDYTSDITLAPDFTPLSYNAVRHDYVIRADGSVEEVGILPSSDSTWKAPMDSVINGKHDFGTAEPDYRGFYFNADNCVVLNTTPTEQEIRQYLAEGKNIVTSCKVNTNENMNVVQRYYLPYIYNITYDLSCEDAVHRTPPATHTYSAGTEVPNPTRVGYVFAGWYINGNETLYAVNPSNNEHLTLGATDYLADITLKALWTPESYTIDYQLVGGHFSDDTFPTAHIYDVDTVVPNPVKRGYTFLGWNVNGTFSAVDAAEGENLLLTACTYLDTITLQAVWQANTYEVTLDGNNATVMGTERGSATFDEFLSFEEWLAPTRFGYTFGGYYLNDVCYVDADGVAVKKWDVDSDATLLAKWLPNPHTVTVNLEHVQAITINGVPYEMGTPFDTTFGTTLTIAFTTDGGYKLVRWNGVVVQHTQTYTYNFTLDKDEDVTLTGLVLPVATTPAFFVDYCKEQLFVNGGIPAGSYRISDGTTVLTLVVAENGSMSVDGHPVSAVTVPDAFFGSTVTIVKCGDGIATADSEPMSMSLAQRPTPDIAALLEKILSDYDSVAVTLKQSSLTYTFEYAISMDADGENLVWQDSNTFTALLPGTTYYVFVRVKAMEGEYPHSEAYRMETNTYWSDYFSEKIAALEALVEDGDGDMVRALIQKAIREANNLAKPSSTFYQELEGIYNRVLAEIEFARVQDGKIAQLKQLYNALLATDAYTESGKQTLKLIYENASAEIAASVTEGAVAKAYENACAQMYLVKISYLYGEDIKLESLLGLSQDVQLSVLKLTDFASWSEAIAKSVQNGNVTCYGDAQSLKALLEALQTQDVLAAYTMRLTDENGTVSRFDGTFKVVLLLPDELKGVDGLRVAFFNHQTGAIELLPTESDGSYLYFTCDRIADFVIFGDSTVDLTALCVTLSITLLCQLLAVVVLLVCRAKSAKAERTYAFLPMVALTVRFAPAGSLSLALLLGVAVLLMQLLLMYLLFSSGVVLRSKRKRTDYTMHRHDESFTSQEHASVQAPHEEEPVLTALTEEEIAEDERYEELYETSEHADDAPAFAPFTEESFDAPADEEVAEEVEEANDETLQDADSYEEDFYAEDDEPAEDFIEPAANPKYFLPEDEDGFVPTADEAEDEESEQVWLEDDEAEFAPVDEAYDTTDADALYGDETEEYSADESGEYNNETYADEVEYGAEFSDEDSETVYADEAVDEELSYEEEFDAEDVADEDVPTEQSDDDGTVQDDFYRYEE